MNIEIANAMSGYFETLHKLENKLYYMCKLVCEGSENSHKVGAIEGGTAYV